jgi:hypothetical protein
MMLGKFKLSFKFMYNTHIPQKKNYDMGGLS